ncbi:antitoxin Xre-like helix-turn-helix domain-containing protein [Marinobacter salicampi]|uniref:antitoxin Xre-like helix-turn-helix domain-containing protein n=1 Tax=Marinobacter salicampi TaxID=435907 RepID=UPI001A94D64D|nr:antitoxin Xre-like helix-turn-helix domain-containing protein [Marinobacter salicampi]
MTHSPDGLSQAPSADAMRGHVALKGFFSICAEWQCSAHEMTQLLGGVSRATLSQYQNLPYVKLPNETLERISYLLGIYKSLRSMYPTAERASRRMRLSTDDFPFVGESALQYMTRGTTETLALTRRYFEAMHASQ